MYGLPNLNIFGSFLSQVGFLIKKCQYLRPNWSLIQVFMEARIFFSLDGERYQQTPLYFSLDTSSEDDWYHHPSLLKDSGGAARNVTIPLQNRVGRFVRLEMDYANKWLLLSEVYFDSGEYVIWSERSDIWLQI